MIRKFVYAILGEWKFLVLVAVLLYGIVSINESIEDLTEVIGWENSISELSDIALELGKIEINLDSVQSHLGSIASQLFDIYQVMR